MPDYGGPGGFGPGTTGGGEAATGGMGPGQGSGYGPSNGGDGGMSQATRDALAAMAETDVSNTDAEVAKSRLAEERDRQMFSQRMSLEADVNNPVKYSDTLALYDALKTQNIITINLFMLKMKLLILIHQQGYLKISLNTKNQKLHKML